MSLLSIALVLPWLFLGLWSWIGFQLIRQNGRLLIHLEDLEAKLDTMGMAPAPAPVVADGPPPESLAIGSEAPAFELPDLHGKTRSLAEFRGRRVLLMFFGPQCGYCIEALPEIARMPIDGKGGAPIPLVISTGGRQENRTLFEASKIRGPVLLQKGMEVASRFKAFGTPIGYLIDEHGAIASAIAVGSQALLDLATIAPAGSAALAATATNGDLKKTSSRSQRPLSTSRLKRDGLAPGTPAPAFRLPTVAGGEVALESYRGRKVVLVFSDPQCGPCDALAPRLQVIHQSRPDLQVLMVSRRDLEANQRKVAELGLTFPVAVQKNWEVSTLYAMFATPIGYLIDERGVIAANVAMGVDAIAGLADATSRPLESPTESRRDLAAAYHES